jgi:hypothetical protein
VYEINPEVVDLAARYDIPGAKKALAACAA